ncbi:hypothetical protein TrVFT333_003507 [Trichoderma virens FT-333]|nr:hypothetical protein TrVFT333_003507 [Trichoderma virens FT-333]
MDALRARRSFRRSNNTAGTADATSPNWAGVAISQTGVTEVSGTFTVPQPKLPAGGDPSVSYCGVAWVGIDGWTNGDLIQTGVLWCITEGETFWDPWYEYLPGAITIYEGVTVSAGSVVTVTATKTGTNSGVTTLTVDGITVSHTFTGENFSLPGTSAEWIVEDYEYSVAGPPLFHLRTLDLSPLPEQPPLLTGPLLHRVRAIGLSLTWNVQTVPSHHQAFLAAR